MAHKQAIGKDRHQAPRNLSERQPCGTGNDRGARRAADPPPAKPPAQVISGVGPEDAATQIADWLAERKLIA